MFYGWLLRPISCILSCLRSSLVVDPGKAKIIARFHSVNSIDREPPSQLGLSDIQSHTLHQHTQIRREAVTTAMILQPVRSVSAAAKHSVRQVGGSACDLYLTSGISLWTWVGTIVLVQLLFNSQDMTLLSSESSEIRRPWCTQRKRTSLPHRAGRIQKRTDTPSLLAQDGWVCFQLETLVSSSVTLP